MKSGQYGFTSKSLVIFQHKGRIFFSEHSCHKLVNHLTPKTENVMAKALFSGIITTDLLLVQERQVGLNWTFG